MQFLVGSRYLLHSNIEGDMQKLRVQGDSVLRMASQVLRCRMSVSGSSSLNVIRVTYTAS